MPKAEYRIRAKVWLYAGKGGWHFVTLSPKVSGAIKARFGAEARAWGSLPVTVRIGETEWPTSIFPESKADCYLLAIKADVRKREHITVGDTITAVVRIR